MEINRVMNFEQRKIALSKIIDSLLKKELVGDFTYSISYSEQYKKLIVSFDFVVDVRKMLKDNPEYDHDYAIGIYDFEDIIEDMLKYVGLNMHNSTIFYGFTYRNEDIFDEEITRLKSKIEHKLLDMGISPEDIKKMDPWVNIYYGEENPHMRPEVGAVFVKHLEGWEEVVIELKEFVDYEIFRTKDYPYLNDLALNNGEIEYWFDY